MIPDGKHFFATGVLKMILEQMGWSMNSQTHLREMLNVKFTPMFSSTEFLFPTDVIPIRPDFYPSGTLLATSKRFEIMCDGHSEIEYKNETFNCPSGIFNRWGIDGLLDIENWNIKLEKEWVIKTTTRNWKWTDYSFSTLNDCPFRATIR